LPELEVLIPENETRPPEVKNNNVTKSTNKPEPAKQYILQVGSFQNIGDAEKLKANLAFLGLEADIQHVTVNNQSWHRVRTGPYRDKQQLYLNQKTLKQNNIDAISMELK
jgi:cell division protein FtsN